MIAACMHDFEFKSILEIKLLNVQYYIHYITTSDGTTSLNLVQKSESGTPSLHAKREYCMVQFSTIVHVRGMAIPSYSM